MAMAITQGWTLDDLLRLPDDGNRYEVIRGALFVTPAPTVEHENIVARLTAILVPYVEGNGLGHVYHPRSIVQAEGSRAEPDLAVRQAPANNLGSRWEEAPTPILVVEVTSRSTRRRDYDAKLRFYLDDARSAEYWIVDREERNIHIFGGIGVESIVADEMVWSPDRSARSLAFSVARLFDGS